MMEKILENVRIDSITRNFPKAPNKICAIHEADAEIIDLGDDSHDYLAITTDALVEEVSSGLYDDPLFIGWMLAMVNFSDLAAVGADPLGLLLTISYSPDVDSKFVAKLTRGISEACQKLNTFVLGGDTNQGKELLLSGCAVGLVPKQTVLTRRGADVNDRLYITHPAGLGNFYAFLKLFKKRFPLLGSIYKPLARIKEGRIIRNFANCCMDTSDGVLHTVDTLMRLNNHQFVLDNDWSRILHPIASKMCRIQKLPPWLALAGIHGEFELIFAVSPQMEPRLHEEAKKIGWKPILIGEVLEGEGVSVRTSDGLIPLDTAAIRNLSEQAGSSPKDYVDQLIQMALNAGIK